MTHLIASNAAPRLNPALSSLGVYASKAISQAAKENPAILNMSIGEPVFGPPEHLLADIARDDLSPEAFLASVKHYGPSGGNPELREAIADWYSRRYGLHIDPQREILITHGGVEAVALAILCCSQPGEAVVVTEPSYMLYQRALLALGRRVHHLHRNFFSDGVQQSLPAAPALIVNSPENPSGYVFDDAEWELLLRQALQRLTPDKGFTWPHRPMGGMFLFPDVQRLFEALAPAQQRRFPTSGECVADYLLHEMQIVWGGNHFCTDRIFSWTPQTQRRRGL